MAHEASWNDTIVRPSDQNLGAKHVPAHSVVEAEICSVMVAAVKEVVFAVGRACLFMYIAAGIDEV